MKSRGPAEILQHTSGEKKNQRLNTLERVRTIASLYPHHPSPSPKAAEIIARTPFWFMISAWREVEYVGEYPVSPDVKKRPTSYSTLNTEWDDEDAAQRMHLGLWEGIKGHGSYQLCHRLHL